MTAFFVNQQHVISLGRGGFHTRRTLRHAGHGQAGCGRTLGQQAPDFARRHMALEGVTIHHAGMAAAQFIGNAPAASTGVEVNRYQCGFRGEHWRR
jgi:hypothetical protein